MPVEIIILITKWVRLQDYKMLRQTNKLLSKLDKVPTLSFNAYKDSANDFIYYSNPKKAEMLREQHLMKLDLEFLSDSSFIYIVNSGHTSETFRLISSRRSYLLSNDVKIEAFRITVSKNYSPDVIEKLITEHNIDPNTEVQSGFILNGTALHWAAAKGHIKLLSFLLNDQRVSLTKREGVGMQALQYAVWNGHPECLRLLLDSGADVNSTISQDWGDYSTLHFATFNGNYSCVEILLSRPNLRVFAEDRYGNQPIHYAIKKKHIEIVRLFLKHPLFVDNYLNKRNVYDWTVEHGFADIARSIKEFCNF